MTIIKSLGGKVLLKMRYYRVEGNWITTSCSIGSVFMILLLTISFDDIIWPTFGLVGFYIGLIAVGALVIVTIMLLSPRLLPKRWYLRITRDGFADCVFGYKRFYLWESIRSYEIKQARVDATGRFKHDLILKLDNRNVRIQLEKYGIDTESEISGFTTVMDSYLLDA